MDDMNYHRHTVNDALLACIYPQLAKLFFIPQPFFKTIAFFAKQFLFQKLIRVLNGPAFFLGEKEIQRDVKSDNYQHNEPDHVITVHITDHLPAK